MRLDPNSVVLHEIAARVLPGSGRPVVERTQAGVSTPVYRICRGETTLYLRLSETPEANLASEALVHNLLHARGVRVPEIVHSEPFNDELQRSVLVTTEIPGTPIGQDHRGANLEGVLAEAGRDLAIVNQVSMEGFGWVRRDQQSLVGEQPTLAAFAFSDLETYLPALANFLTSGEIREIGRVIARYGTWFDADRAVLAHGDFDATHIYQVGGVYTGIIDFGEIRGTDQLYDLGHFALHDGEMIPDPLLPHLLRGYDEAASLPSDYVPRIQLWSLLIGITALARSIHRRKSVYQVHLAGAIRSALTMLPM